MTKRYEMDEAISKAVSDGEQVYFGGFTHLIPFAAGHEIIRQGQKDLEVVRTTPDLIFDQLIAAGCASKLTFSYAGNPGVGSLRGFRRAVEDGVPHEIAIEEYSHFGLVSRLAAGAKGLPFAPLQSYRGSSYLEHNESIRTIENPYDEGPNELAVVPALSPDVAIVRAQRADAEGNAHLWGITGEVVEAAFAAETVVLVVEEVVDRNVIRSDPNRTRIPGTVVDYVVEEPYGSHPSYAQGYYDRDNEAYLEWDKISQSHESTRDWLDEWVYSVANRTEYLEKLDTGRFLNLQPGTGFATTIDMGAY
ncbi:CoA transferase subunit A [Natronosalvus halobius]|uniref:CoA transferase subunit A n=1 Tax=Natronosalvus halobius TaxID=2953746 RepID=UPI00209C89D6|nr:malonate decarboxylase subunit alpha [Natronosalvus halobius]USZ73708.1 malonate decarboxylase subunit alpha [Natronosalvus halobius]